MLDSINYLVIRDPLVCLECGSSEDTRSFLSGWNVAIEISLSTRFFTSDVPTAVIGIYASVGALCSALLIVLFTGNWIPMSSIQDWLWLISMGSVGGCAVLCLITAYRMADPSSLSPLEYFGIPFSFLLGWMFFDETPFDSLFPGVLFIVAGGLLVIWRERQVGAS